MTAECIVRFLDIEANVMREGGDRFEVTPERFEAINGTEYGELVREVKHRGRRPKKKE